MRLLRNAFKISLFISSYIPLYFLIFIKEMDNLNFESVLKVFNKNSRFWIIIVLLSLLSLISLKIFLSGNYTNRETFINVQSLDSDILNYFITYIIPLITVDITKNTSVLVNLIIITIVGIYYISSDLIHLNILLILNGYKVYTDEFNNIIISKKDRDYLKRKEDILCKKIGNSKIFIVKNQD